MHQHRASDEEVERYARSVRVERDVIYFLHQQAAYASIMDDVDWSFMDEDYASVLVENLEMPPAIQRGCLAMFYAMGMCEAWNVSIALGERLPKALEGLERFRSEDGEVQQLKSAAIQALVLASAPEQSRDWDAIKGHYSLGTWVHDASVKRYFREIARGLMSTSI